MADVTDAEFIAYLKSNNLYGPLAAAAGAAPASKSQPDVGAVHVPSAGGKPPAAVGEADEDEKTAPEAATEAATAKADPGLAGATMAKRLVLKRITDVDPVFAKLSAGFYAARYLTPASAKRLYDWAVKEGIPNVVPPELMHVTQAYSTKKVDGLTPVDTLLDVKDEGRYLDSLGADGKALVLHVWVPEMQQRFKDVMAAGADWKWSSFRPHITLSYDAGTQANWMMHDAPTFPLQLQAEVFTDNNESWAQDNGLKKGGTFEATIQVAKVMPDKQMIFGWASITHIDGKVIVDHQDEAILLLDEPGDVAKGIEPTTGLESAAYEFVLYSRQHGDMHSKMGTGRLVESFVFTPDKAAAGIVAKNDQGQQIYGWWTGFRVDDPATWDSYRSGGRPEFSIGGKATPVEM